MIASETTYETVVLKGGVTVPLAALQVGWELEARGLTLTVDGSDLVIAPRGHLSDTDRERIRAHKAALMSIVQYCDTVAL